jgi:hypothetical protein
LFKIFPSLVFGSQENIPLTEQAVYDIRNEMRKASEINDFDDEYDSEDEDFEIENDNQQSIQIFSSSTIRSHIINSIIPVLSIKTTTRIITTTTISSEINNQETETIESKISNDKYLTVPSSSSSRFVPMFICLLFSFSSLYRSNLCE